MNIADSAVVIGRVRLKFEVSVGVRRAARQ